MGRPWRPAKAAQDEIYVMLQKKSAARKIRAALSRSDKPQKWMIRSDETTRALLRFGGAPVSLLPLKAGASKER